MASSSNGGERLLGYKTVISEKVRSLHKKRTMPLSTIRDFTFQDDPTKKFRVKTSSRRGDSSVDVLMREERPLSVRS